MTCRLFFTRWWTSCSSTVCSARLERSSPSALLSVSIVVASWRVALRDLVFEPALLPALVVNVGDGAEPALDVAVFVALGQSLGEQPAVLAGRGCDSGARRRTGRRCGSTRPSGRASAEGLPGGPFRCSAAGCGCSPMPAIHSMPRSLRYSVTPSGRAVQTFTGMQFRMACACSPRSRRQAFGFLAAGDVLDDAESAAGGGSRNRAPCRARRPRSLRRRAAGCGIRGLSG